MMQSTRGGDRTHWQATAPSDARTKQKGRDEEAERDDEKDGCLCVEDEVGDERVGRDGGDDENVGLRDALMRELCSRRRTCSQEHEDLFRWGTAQVTDSQTHSATTVCDLFLPFPTLSSGCVPSTQQQSTCTLPCASSSFDQQMTTLTIPHPASSCASGHVTGLRHLLLRRLAVRRPVCSHHYLFLIKRTASI